MWKEHDGSGSYVEDFGSRRKSEKVENENLIYDVFFIFKLNKI